MSKCIGSHGEYSEHEITDGVYCDWCGELDVAAVERAAAVKALRDAAEEYAGLYRESENEGATPHYWEGAGDAVTHFELWLRARAERMENE